MISQPVLPSGGYSGWRFLQATLETQQARFAASPAQAADRAYFRENIAEVRTAEDLVSDYRLLRVALGAYGLQDDLPNRAFIRQVLDQGTEADGALANRLANKSYRALSEAFGFGAASAPEAAPSSGGDRAINDERYFRDTVASIRSVDDLLEEGRALRVALAAFGLDADLPDRDFLRGLFEGGTASAAAPARRQENPAYAALVDAFGFTEPGGPRTAAPGFASEILSGLDRIAFARRLEAGEAAFRDAAATLPELAALAGRGFDDRRAWVAVVTDPALRGALAASFGQSRGFDRLNLDEQIATLKAGARAAFGDATVAQFADPARMADLLARHAEAMAFEGEAPRGVEAPGFADQILRRYDRQQFELAVGARDGDLRLALNLSRELPEIAARGTSDTTAWLTILGTPPLRRVFEVAFAMPDAIATLDLDQQVREFREASERVLGRSDLAQFTDPAQVEDLVRAFTLQSQLAAGPSPLTRGAAALALLRTFA